MSDAPAVSAVPSPAPRAVQKRVLLVIFLTAFLDLVGFGIIIPIQPFIAGAYGAEPWLITMLGASYSLMQFLFAPLWGRLSDRVGRRPVMLTSIAASVVGFTLFGLAGSLGMLFAARMLAGFGNANIGTAQAIIADVTDPENRAKGMGLIGAAFGLGFIAGPALGGFAGVELGPDAPAFIAAGLSALNWLLAFWLLPESHPAFRARPGQGRDPSYPVRRNEGPLFGISLEQVRRVARYPNLPQILVVYFLFSFAFSQMEQTFSLYVERVWVAPAASSAAADVEAHIKEAARLTTYVLLVVGVTATVVQGGLIGTLARAFGERRLLIIGTLLATAGLVLIPVSGAVGMYGLLLVTGLLLACGSGLTNPSLPSLLSRHVDPMEQGLVLGIGQSLAALGRVAGPALSGAFFQVAAPLPFLTGAGLMLGCTLAALLLRGQGRAAVRR